MDSEEIQLILDKLISQTGKAGEDIFTLSIDLERIRIFNELRLLLMQKDAVHDQTAVDVLTWAISALSETR